MYNPLLTNAILFVIILIGIVPALRRLNDSSCEKLMTVLGLNNMTTVDVVFKFVYNIGGE